MRKSNIEFHRNRATCYREENETYNHASLNGELGNARSGGGCLLFRRTDEQLCNLNKSDCTLNNKKIY